MQKDKMLVFGRCLDAAGVEGHYGEGHLHYKLPGRKPDFTGSTFVSKTQTWLGRRGNVKTPWRFWEYAFPSWARLDFSSGHILNAMSLPGPGIRAALETGKWQQRTQPFIISIMAVQDTLEKRLDELNRITDAIAESATRERFETWPIGIQVNRSCPNTGHNINISEIVEESEKGLEILSQLALPVQEKFAIDTAPVEAVKELQYNPYCDGICVSNTVKYGYQGLVKRIWGKDVSPLAHLGGGGISGPKLLPLVCDYIKHLRDIGFEKNINGGGGIFLPQDVDTYFRAGADSIFVGTVATYYPWRVPKIIEYARTRAWQNVR